MILASKSNEHECVAMLIAAGCDINATDDSLSTSLMHAASRGHVESTKHLMDSGADLNLCDSNFWTATTWVASKNRHLLEVGSSSTSGSRCYFFQREWNGVNGSQI